MFINIVFDVIDLIGHGTFYIDNFLGAIMHI
jgi:hypothetical protein